MVLRSGCVNSALFVGENRKDTVPFGKGATCVHIRLCRLTELLFKVESMAGICVTVGTGLANT